MDEENNLITLPQPGEDNLPAVQWTRGIAAGAFVLSAVLLLTGRRRSGMLAAAAGAAAALMENPDAVRDFWNSIPRYVRTGQDFLTRAEEFVEEINRQTDRVRNMVSREA